MVLRTKDHHAIGDGTNNRHQHARLAQRIPLPHNSMFVLGLRTNSSWLHGIRQDKRSIREKSAEEMAFQGERISLTFRHIGTFLTEKGTHMWGQGCKGKTKEDMRPVVVGDELETSKMIRAFGQENQRSDFHWNTVYGEGFDVLHFTMK
jgi:2OG-Fe(II) oxygenase superfamily